MKLKKSFIFLMIISALLVNSFEIFAQDQKNAEQTVQKTAEAMSEDDRLPFMQTEQNAKEEASTIGIMAKTFGAMILIVGLIFVGAWGLKKFGFANSSTNLLSDAPELSVLSTISLGNGRTISTIKFGEKVLLVGSTAQSFTLLGDAEENEKIASANPRSVAEMLAEENYDFSQEFEQAENRLRLLENEGEKI